MLNISKLTLSRSLSLLPSCPLSLQAEGQRPFDLFLLTFFVLAFVRLAEDDPGSYRAQWRISSVPSAPFRPSASAKLWCSLVVSSSQPARIRASVLLLL